MKHIDTILTDIAVKHLRIPTLAERRSDRLDFHSVSVWGVRANSVRHGNCAGLWWAGDGPARQLDTRSSVPPCPVTANPLLSRSPSAD